MTDNGDSGELGGVTVASPEPTPPFSFPPAGGHVEPTAPPPVAWWQRHLLPVVTVVALLAGAAGALVTDAVHTSTKTASVATPATTVAPSTSPGQTLSDADIVATVEPALVTITVKVSQQTAFGTATGTAAGTGMILTAGGLVATNAHVVAGAESIEVSLAGQSAARAATLVGQDSTADVALLQIVGASGLPTVKLGNSRSVRVGDDVLAIGNALDLEGDLTVSRGIVSALNRTVPVEDNPMTRLIQTDAAISSGNSGGPLLNASGQVIGMTTLAVASTRGTTAENIGFAIPVNQALTVLQRLGLSQTAR